MEDDDDDHVDEVLVEEDNDHENHDFDLDEENQDEVMEEAVVEESTYFVNGPSGRLVPPPTTTSTPTMHHVPSTSITSFPTKISTTSPSPIHPSFTSHFHTHRSFHPSSSTCNTPSSVPLPSSTSSSSFGSQPIYSFLTQQSPTSQSYLHLGHLHHPHYFSTHSTSSSSSRNSSVP
ncbi:hypothetical protein HMI55_004512 [Coelomomyces lativittatus]|nr:hypothetical protein HMI55_004512 [Coelomomyces lativittatus]